ncbi:hypothetical protein PoB_007476000 [Plakobranchus ocellatus]|uniref:Uncharacterized protein n=1 Tax=Plakobranchus ocellatus TaxID=259542 RepID=A0AAV4DW09_9GAST|nr:hypothetical protein PoB_007476000 [Plakobranchus ocellatus]
MIASTFAAVANHQTATTTPTLTAVTKKTTNRDIHNCDHNTTTSPQTKSSINKTLAPPVTASPSLRHKGTQETDTINDGTPFILMLLRQKSWSNFGGRSRAGLAMNTPGHDISPYIPTPGHAHMSLPDTGLTRQAHNVTSACSQQGDLRLSCPPSGPDANGGARTHDRGVPADLKADLLATVPSTPSCLEEK